jgi:hypothetical protein
MQYCDSPFCDAGVADHIVTGTLSALALSEKNKVDKSTY